MSSNQLNLDPALGGPVDSKSPLPPQRQQYERPPPSQLMPGASSLNPPPYPPAPSPSQPYYPYPSPHTHTPQQSTGAASIASQSNQASPAAAIGFPAQDDGDHSADEGGAGGEDPKRPRACEACRGLKVRCDQDPAHPELPCRRCQKANRQCIITAPSRKRQKKADNRVAELEKKLDALTAVLQQQQAVHSQYGSPHNPGAAPPSADMMQGRQSSGSIQQSMHQYPPQLGSVGASPARPDSTGMQPPQKRRRTEDGPRETESLDAADVANPGPTSRYGSATGQYGHEMYRQMNDTWGPGADSLRHLVHRSPEEFMNRINSLVSLDMGVSIFNRYIAKLAPHMPAVVFPADITAEQIRKEKPILFACILSATSAGMLPPDISHQLSRESIRAIADCVVCNGAKSLELIQAMQVMALWYKPPERAEQTNFYQIIHMAAVMAIDIGLGKRFNATKARRGFGGPNADMAPGPHMMLPQNSDTIEARRAWLGCYYLCASASMVLRRPNLIRWSNYMRECVEILETSPEAYESDKLFCQHIKIQHICEDIGLQFLMDDNTANISITDPKVTYQLNVLENELKAWADDIPPQLKSHPGLKFFEHVASLYLHEIALHFNHNIEDFKLPFTEESLKAVNNTSETLTQHQMAALEACRRSAHGILDMMLTFDIPTVKTLPMLIFFVRCTYALVILIKMHVAITTPGSEISKIMTSDDVRVDYYIDRLMNMFGSVANEQEFRPHPKILRILSVLKDWFRKHKDNVAAQSRGEQLPHPPTTSLQERQKSDSAPSGQSGLQLLSQVATGNSTSQAQSSGQQSSAWTYDSPHPVRFGSTWKNVNTTAYPFDPTQEQQQQAPAAYPPPADNGTSGTYGGNMMDQYGLDGSLPDYLWGSGFEQAMEMNLGSMDGLMGGGMDGLFLGGGMAPFSFNGDVATTGQQWQ